MSIDQSKIRNFCIIAHIDHGKSTLADRIIEKTGTLTSREMQAQVLDNMDLERERGITIKSQAVRIIYQAKDGEEYIFNLIDTPGHVDFNYEVSRSLAACDGAILVVDAAQGVEAQTLANVYLALDHDLDVLPVINKIDLPSARPEEVAQEIEDVIGIEAMDAPRISAKTGLNIEEVLEQIVTKIPAPAGDPKAPLKALIFDALYDSYKGVIVFCRIKEGTVKVGTKIKMMATGAEDLVTEVGYFGAGQFIPCDELSAGMVGYITASIKNVKDTRVGDTITDAAEPITPEKQAEIERWLASQPKHQPADSVTEKRSNLLIVFAESLESWVLEKKVDGKEITPCLNRLLKEKSTLYAPNVLTQVKGGRSIDAQLMICSGLLPLMSGTYSSLYYDNTFYTLQKAMRWLKHSRSYLLTIDKVSTWNQGAVARSFGTDTIISYHDFKMTEAFGTHKRIGDASFFKQCREKIERGEVWKPGESVYMQFVTYSGHAPFKLPNHLRTITFPASIPEKAADYMTTAHYTDKAIGDFVAYLKTLPQYKETIVVIVGDHEGLASYRQELVGNPACRGLVSDKQLTPFIVLNSPVGMRYDKFMGQIDIYPTLLNLMQLDAYRWHGLGQSILDPRKQGVAVGSVMNVEGTGSDKEVERLKEAHTVSDYMLRYDWLKRLD